MMDKRVRAILDYMIQHEQIQSQWWIMTQLLAMGFSKQEIGVAFMFYLEKRA